MEDKVDTLVILSPGFAANEADTTCLAPMQVFVKALKEVCPGLHVVVLAFQYPFIAAEYDWHGVEVIAIGGKSKGRLLRLRTWLEAWILLRKLNKEYNLLGILNFWFGECALVGSYFAKANHLTQYTWLLGQDAKRGNKYFKWIGPQKDSLIALSDFIARQVSENYGISPLQVISLGIDTSLFSDALIKRDIDILGAGSLISLKQYRIFVNAIAVIKESFPAVKAVICGKGTELQALQAMATELNLQDNLFFAGELPHAEVLEMMQRSKVFLHPSAYEGFGAVMAEALYAGAHVVSFVKPMDKAYRHHHVVDNIDEMNSEVLKLLKTSRRGHDPVLLCPIQQTAKNMISLFVE